MKRINSFLIIMVIAGTLACHRQKSDESRSLAVTKDSVFNRLFHQDANGLTGADGTISVPMPNGSSVFMMGDSFLGEVVNDKRDTTTKMIHNTFVIVNPQQTNTRTLYQGTYQDPESFVIPENDPGKFYWPGDGFVRDSVFHFFMSRFWIPGKGMWGFEFLNTDYFRYSWPDFQLLSVESFRYTLLNHVHWGHAILDAGKYIYIYGCKAEKNDTSRAFVCRTGINDKKSLDLTEVEFYDGNSWTKDPMNIKPMQGTTTRISEQFSVFRYKNKYILLSQDKELGSGKIYTYTSVSPSGPWKNKQLIYEATESAADPNIITYNAMAHPQYIKNDELLISYNVNSLKIAQVFENVNSYRPGFLRVPMKKILGNPEECLSAKSEK